MFCSSHDLGLQFNSTMAYSGSIRLPHDVSLLYSSNGSCSFCHVCGYLMYFLYFPTYFVYNVEFQIYFFYLFTETLAPWSSMFCYHQSLATWFGMAFQVLKFQFIPLVGWIYMFVSLLLIVTFVLLHAYGSCIEFMFFILLYILNWWGTFFVNRQRQDSSALFSRLHAPFKPVSSRCNVLLCRSALIPAGGCEAPLMKVATVSLSRSLIYLLCSWDKFQHSLTCMSILIYYFWDFLIVSRFIDNHVYSYFLQIILLYMLLVVKSDNSYDRKVYLGSRLSLICWAPNFFLYVGRHIWLLSKPPYVVSYLVSHKSCRMHGYFPSSFLYDISYIFCWDLCWASEFWSTELGSSFYEWWLYRSG